MKKTISILLALAMVFSLCIGMTVTGFAAGETITAEAQGTYTQSADAQDITVRISVNGLSTPYCVFGINGGTTVPENFIIKSFSTSNTAQPIVAGDYNTDNGQLTYITSDVEDTIPGDTYYDVVIEAPANASGTFEIVFNQVEINNQYGANSLVRVNAVTASVTITAAAPAEGYGVALSSDVTEIAKDGAINLYLDVTHASETAFNAFYAVLTYDSAKVAYNGAAEVSGFTVDSATPGTLKLSKTGADVTIGDSHELSLPFTANAAGSASFELTAKVDKAANAESDAPNATISGSPLAVTVQETYTVTFVGGDGATGDAPTQEPVTAGTKITLPANTFTKENHTFAGWNDGTTTYDAGAEYTVNANVTFTAQWTENPTVPTVTGSTSTYFTGYTLIAATIDMDGYVPTYDGNAMFTVAGYADGTYYYVISGAYDASKLGYVAGTAANIAQSNDVNETGVVDINDAQFVYNIYNGTAPTTNVVQRLLLADVNRDKTVNVSDCAAVVAAIG